VDHYFDHHPVLLLRRRKLGRQRLRLRVQQWLRLQQRLWLQQRLLLIHKLRDKKCAYLRGCADREGRKTDFIDDPVRKI